MFELRDYQKEAVEAAFNFFYNKDGNTLIALPTGTGKSIVIAEIIKRSLTYWPNVRVLMLTHVKELIAQNASKLKTIWPECPLGIYSAGLKIKEPNQPVLFGGIQSAKRALDKDLNSLGKRNLIIIDECHLISPSQKTSYQTVLSKLKEIHPRMRVLGLTATPYRSKSGSIYGEGSIFQDVCYDRCSMDNFNSLMDAGYLAPLIPKRTKFTLDASDIKVTAGDFNKKDLDSKINLQEITYKAVEEMVLCGQDRKFWLVFGSSIEHCENISGMLESFGISSATVHNRVGDKENDERIKAFKNGEIRALVNMNKLTTGFDHPPIDLIGMLRATLSPGLWVQMLGRGTRPHPGKENCLVLDFAGNTLRLGPINDPVIPEKRTKSTKKGEAPVRICERCGMYNHLSHKVCYYCGFQFEIKQKIKSYASSQELIRNSESENFSENLEEQEILEFDVSRIAYSKHVKNVTSPPTMKVNYYCGTKRFSEWLCFEHEGYPKIKAHRWWSKRTSIKPPPTVEQAVKNAPDMLKRPKKIRVVMNKNGKGYPKIKEFIFNG